MPRERALPYRFDREQLDLYVVGVDVGGRDKENAIRRTKQQIPLQESENWNETTLTVEVELHESAHELLPEDERVDPPWEVVLATRCTEAKWRRKFHLENDHGRWTGGITVKRDEVRGALDLQAFLVRTAEAGAESSEFARRKSARLASSPEWKVYFDEPQMPSGGGMEFWWESFEENERLPDSDKHIYYIDLSDNPPTVYLNQDVQELQSILHSKATRGSEAAIRNLVEDSLGQSLWLTLAIDSILSKRDENMEERVPRDWKVNVFRRFEEELYGRGIPAPDEDIRDPEALEEVLQELVEAVQEHVNTRKSTEKIINELRRAS
ncbi:hypothetical protein [Salinibacter ruber]|uniref:hypothetical protein n=1 Tax=Salinibacter ruber TaxID=146919 RepID=UPI0013C33635|nr:hypothetical protein [Salinibacter ruber]